MASPQLENGYTKIANELLEAFARTNFSAYQRRVIDAIVRKTYGYRKKMDHIPISQIVELTQIHKCHVSRALKELNHRNIVTRLGNQIAINKNWQGWQQLPNGVTRKKVTPSGLKVTQRGIKKLPDGAGSKERKKLSKEIYAHFDEFWSAYPRKVDKKRALKVWEKLKPSKELADTILGAVEKQRQAKEQKQTMGEFVPEWPHPTTWLNGERWEDEVINPKDSGLCEKCGTGQKYLGGLCIDCYYDKGD